MIQTETVSLAQELSPVGILLGISLVLIGAGFMIDAAARRRKPKRRPAPDVHETTWDDVAAALAHGCLVTEDVLPLGPVPDWLVEPYCVVPFVPSHKPKTAEGMVFCCWMQRSSPARLAS